MLLIICVERLLHIGSHFSLRKWQRRPHSPTKLAAAASFSYKIGGGGKDLATLLAAVLTWSGYWADWCPLPWSHSPVLSNSGIHRLTLATMFGAKQFLVILSFI